MYLDKKNIQSVQIRYNTSLETIRKIKSRIGPNDKLLYIPVQMPRTQASSAQLAGAVEYTNCISAWGGGIYSTSWYNMDCSQVHSGQKW